ncbi:MAG TPA: site-2 protease family protein [Gemmatimonadaceae bacterium]|nr:site-2 protease family protein [Gemmatimonadaceae bacterium]
MLSSLLTGDGARRRLPRLTLRQPRWSRADLPTLARRLAHFWIVWSALLLVHEAGHAVTARHQGLAVRRVTVGVGPVLWRGERGHTEVVLRLVPLAGLTKLGAPPAAPADEATAATSTLGGAGGSGRWSTLSEQVTTLGGGVLATLALALGVAGVVALRERATGRRWVWGRILVADAVVLTVFNFLPVPPLDGGRAVLGAVAALRGAPLSGDARFWVQVGGLALAVAPMTLWTRWTARIDALAMWWKAPAAAR